MNHFESGWQALQATRQVLSQESAQLQKKLNKFSEEPEIIQMLRQKDWLEKKVKELILEINSYKFSIQIRTRLVKYSATPNAESKKQLERARIDFLKKVKRMVLGRKQVFYESSFQIISDIVKSVKMPPADLAIYFTRRNTEDTQSITDAELFIQETQTLINDIRINFKRVKASLEKMITANYQERQRNYQTIQEYEKHFAEDHPLVCINNPPVQPARLPRKKHVQESRIEELTTPESVEPWELFILSSSTDSGTRVGLKQREFVKEVKPFIHSNVRGLNISTLHGRLIALTKMDMHQRQLGITKILEPKFHGWQRLRIGGYRIPILIDENLRQIKFAICKKGDESYAKK